MRSFQFLEKIFLDGFLSHFNSMRIFEEKSGDTARLKNGQKVSEDKKYDVNMLIHILFSNQFHRLVSLRG